MPDISAMRGGYRTLRVGSGAYYTAERSESKMKIGLANESGWEIIVPPETAEAAPLVVDAVVVVGAEVPLPD